MRIMIIYLSALILQFSSCQSVNRDISDEVIEVPDSEEHFGEESIESQRAKRGIAKSCRYTNVPWSDCDPNTWMRTKVVK